MSAIRKMMGVSTDASEELEGFKLKKNELCLECLKIKDFAYSLNDCDHYVCSSCWASHVIKAIEDLENTVLTCTVCNEILAFPHAQTILKNPKLEHYSDYQERENYLETYDDFLFNQFLLQEKDYRSCPNKCGYGVIGGDDCFTCPDIDCENCTGQSFCYICRKGECDCEGLREEESSQGTEAGNRDQVNNNGRHNQFLASIQTLYATFMIFLEDNGFGSWFDSSDSNTTGIPLDETQTISRIGGDGHGSYEVIGKAKMCPNCRKYVTRVDEINLVRCTSCENTFCWLCNRRAGDIHFDSVYGCGAKAQTRKNPLISIISLLVLMIIGFPLIAVIELLLALSILGYITYQCYVVFHDLNAEVTNLGKCMFITLFTLIGLCSAPLIFVAGYAILLILTAAIIYLYFPFILLINFTACKSEACDVYKTASDAAV